MTNTIPDAHTVNVGVSSSPPARLILPNEMGIVIAPMNREHGTETSELIRRTIAPLPYYNDRAKQEELAKYTPAALNDLIADDPDSVVVATIDSNVVGFCVSRYDDGLLWLAWFGVDDAHRNAGIGTLLLNHLLGGLKRRNAHKVWCDTRTSNETSARVLQRAGLTRVAELKNHWYGQDFYLWES